jgi:NitT/TauT family transport system ATP-binding protein
VLEIDLRGKRHRSATGERVQALGPVSFEIAAGEVVAVMGPSGCGKSTLMRLIAGLDKDVEGRIGRPPDLALGMVFQEPTLLPWRTVEQNVRLVMKGRPDDAPFLDALLARMELEEHRRKYPGELAVGLARRVAIARALAARPDLLILDEPFASLDTPLIARLQAHVGREIAARRITTLLVTHRLEDALPLASRLLVFSPRPGRILADVAVPPPDAVAELAALRARLHDLLHGVADEAQSATSGTP